MFDKEQAKKDQVRIQSEFSTEQTKYIYFLLAAAGSAIALAVNWTRGHELTWTLIPVGMAVLSWGISFYSGCQYMQKKLNILYNNAMYFEIAKGTSSIAGNDPAKMAYAEELVRKDLNDKVEKSTKWFRRQFMWLIIGAALFVGWHVLEICLQVKPEALSAL